MINVIFYGKIIDYYYYFLWLIIMLIISIGILEYYK